MGRWLQPQRRHFFIGALVAAVVVLLSTPGLRVGPVLAEEDAGDGFTVDVDARAEMGDAAVVVDLMGEFGGPRGQAAEGEDEEARGFCEGGQVVEGSVAISDADSNYTGTLSDGWVNAGDCVPGLTGVLTFQVQGVMDDDAFTEFNLMGLAKIGGDGKLTELVGLFDSWTEYDWEAMAETLNAPLYAFGGKFTGTGKSTGFQVAGGGGTFQLNVAGEDKGQQISLAVSGSLVSDPGHQGPPMFEAESATLKVGGKTYSVDLKKFNVWTWDRGRGEVRLAGTVMDGTNKAGVLIGRLYLENMSEEELEKGGSGDVSGRVTKLQVGGSNYRPQLEGTLTINP